MESELLTVKEVAELLAISQRTVWKFSVSGKLPAPITIGGKIKRWSRKSVMQWIEKGAELSEKEQKRLFLKRA